MTLAQINEFSIRRFGHDAIAIGSLAALWLANAILEEKGVNVYKRIANARSKMGKGTTFPEYGSELFKLI